ncbi:MAG: DNA polymerase III subunit delta' [Acidobacteriota bacterium]|nr:DNA polymerase III subunit delta' [Acidobacteriota bacterium]
MPFSDFQGNAETVHTLREMLARERFPHAVILSGPQGSGKYTLAQMVAKAMNCVERPLSDGRPDFCGRCLNCVRIGEADALEERFAEAVEARENLRDADKRDTRILVQTHPDVMVIPPDPPQMLVKVDQVRRVIHEIYYRPAESGERVYIFSDADFMKEAANSLLKVLEEPPEFATIFLLTDNPTALLPTIRSRCMHLRLAPLPAAEVEQYLAKVRPQWKAKERALVARVCGGGLGRARTFDLAAYLAARQDALTLLGPAMGTADHSALFRATDTYRAGADGKAKTEQLVRTLYGLLEDLLFLKSGTPELVRNHDIQPDLVKMAAQVDFPWLATAAQRLGEVETGMRRNLLRSLALDTFATSLER